MTPTDLWEYESEARAGYDSNTVFAPEGPSDEFLSARGRVARFVRGRRGHFRLGGGGQAFAYATDSTWNRADANAAFDGSRALSSNLTLSADGSAELGHTDTNGLLYDQGVLLPLARTRAGRGSAKVDWRIGARSSLHVDGRAYVTDFDSPLLVDSSSQRGSLTLERRMTGRGSLSAYYSIERAWSGSSHLTHFGSLRWEQVLSKRTAVLFEGGASYTDQGATSGLANTWNFYGGVSLTRELGRSRVVLFGRREVTPVFGIGGLQLSDRFGLQADVPLGRAWQLTFSGSHVIRAESDTSDRISSDDATFTLQRSMGRRFLLGAGARYRRQGPRGSIPAIEQVQADLVLTFGNTRPGRS